LIAQCFEQLCLQSGKLEGSDLFRVFGVNLNFEIGSIKRRLEEYVVEKLWSGFQENLKKEIRARIGRELMNG
jgi:hypothetical protein